MSETLHVAYKKYTIKSVLFSVNTIYISSREKSYVFNTLDEIYLVQMRFAMARGPQMEYQDLRFLECVLFYFVDVMLSYL